MRLAAARDDEAERRTRVRTDEWKEQVELLTENLGGDAELDQFLRHVATKISNVDPYLTRGREITKVHGEASDSLVHIQDLLADSVTEILRTIDGLLGKQQARVEAELAVPGGQGHPLDLALDLPHGHALDALHRRDHQAPQEVQNRVGWGLWDRNTHQVGPKEW